MTQNREQARKVSHRWPLISGLVLVAAVVLGGVLLGARASNLPIDVEWMEEIVENRSPVLEAPALVLNFVGGGWFARFVVPLLAIGLFCLYRRFWAALYLAITMLSSVAAVQLLKSLFGRARPVEMLVTSDFGSFPSGHVANAATLAVALSLILARAWVWWVGAVYTVAMMLSRTYLGAHWLTDTIGGLLLGGAVAVIIWAPFASRLQQETGRPPLWRPLEV
jgi:membrane-associated phospholipid phosphatase